MSQITILNQANAPMGPFTRAQVAEKLERGEFTLDSLAHVEGLSQWTPLGEVLAKVDAAAPLLPPAAPIPAVATQPAGAPAYSYAATMLPPPHMVYAGFWYRVAAHLLDNLIVSVPFVTIWFIAVLSIVGVGAFSAASRQNGSGSDTASAGFIITIILAYIALILGRFLAIWLYHAMLESGPHQSTWGKRIMGLKVTSYTGQRISFWHATGRYFSMIVTNMTMGIGYLMVAFTDRKQTLHDMIAGTLVIKE